MLKLYDPPPSPPASPLLVCVDTAGADRRSFWRERSAAGFGDFPSPPRHIVHERALGVTCGPWLTHISLLRVHFARVRNDTSVAGGGRPRKKKIRGCWKGCATLVKQRRATERRCQNSTKTRQTKKKICRESLCWLPRQINACAHSRGASCARTFRTKALVENLIFFRFLRSLSRVAVAPFRS